MPPLAPGSAESTQSDTTSRRDFLGHLATTAAVLAAAGCATQANAASAIAATAAPAPKPAAAPRPRLTPAAWDDSWTSRITGAHKAVFDCAKIQDGEGVGHPFGYMQGVHDALGVSFDQVHTVLVIRHEAIPLALNDAMWAKYELGKNNKVKDGKHWAERNPSLNPSPGRSARPGDEPDYTLSWLARHNHTLLGCNRALVGCSYEIADRTKADQAAIYQELAANLVPGLILQPNGIYATIRAQEAGCEFFKST